jgi:diguanylate cyclase (GGDEF)-like protein
MLSYGANHAIITNKDKDVYGYFFIRDITNKPIAIMRITMPRTTYIEGIKTVHYYLGIMIVIGILVTILVWYLLKIFVLNRIISVSEQVAQISSYSKFSNRINIKGNDEISQMVATINSMMEIIHLSQQQILYRMSTNTDELEHLSLLNRNLFTEMSRNKYAATQLKEQEKLLRQVAFYDGLTGLPNRIFFNEIVKKQLASIKADTTALIAFLFLDADKFKSINDSYGHDIGDKYLKHVASILESTLRETDIVARLGGDEFIIALSNCKDKETIGMVANKLLHNLATPFVLNDFKIALTFSIGISLFPQDGSTIEILEKHADMAMYYAKKHDGNSFHFYDQIKKNPPITNT